MPSSPKSASACAFKSESMRMLIFVVEPAIKPYIHQYDFSFPDLAEHQNHFRPRAVGQHKYCVLHTFLRIF